jgi:hypothetical protein
VGEVGCFGCFASMFVPFYLLAAYLLEGRPSCPTPRSLSRPFSRRRRSVAITRIRLTGLRFMLGMSTSNQRSAILKDLRLSGRQASRSHRVCVRTRMLRLPKERGLAMGMGRPRGVVRGELRRHITLRLMIV